MYSKLKNPILDKKYISMRVMEAHLTAKDEISTCSTFESPTSEKLQVSVRLQQDIGPEGEKTHAIPVRYRQMTAHLQKLTQRLTI